MQQWNSCTHVPSNCFFPVNDEKEEEEEVDEEEREVVEDELEEIKATINLSQQCSSRAEL